VANSVAILIFAAPMIVLTAWAIGQVTGHTDVITWQESGFGPVQLVAALLVANLIGWTFASIVLLIPLTVGLVQRQRVRRTLVRVGRSRSWVARPGEGSYAAGPVPTAQYDSFSDEDRMVERLPRYQANAAPQPDEFDPRFGSPTPGGPGFGPGPGPGFGAARPPIGGPGFGPGPGAAGPGFGQGPGFGPGPGAPGPSGGPGFGPAAGPGFGPGFGQTPRSPGREDSGFGGSGFGGADPD
jgi:hypothetical protein